MKGLVSAAQAQAPPSLLAYLTVFPRVAGLTLAEILRVVFGAGALVEAGRGEAGVDLCLAQRALVAGRADTLEPRAQGDTDTLVLAGD